VTVGKAGDPHRRRVGCASGHARRQVWIRGTGPHRLAILGQTLFAFTALMAGARQQLAVFMLAHLFTAFLDDTAQWITPSLFVNQRKRCK
jgi:hypothetical protein